LATAGYEQRVSLWDVRDPRQPAHQVDIDTGDPYHLAFSPDGHSLGISSDERSNTASLWDIGDPKQPVKLSSLVGHTDSVYAICFSPDGRVVATSSVDSTTMLWDVTDRSHPTRLAVLSAHVGPVNSAVFAPDGKRLVALGDDGTTIWVVKSRSQLTPLDAGLSGQYFQEAMFAQKAPLRLSGVPTDRPRPLYRRSGPSCFRLETPSFR